MNCQKVYNQIIESAQLKNRKKGGDLYLENHHINPKCLNGTNDKINLVLLTGREHFIVHKLLTKIYPDNRKLALAFHKMAFSKRKIYEMTSRDYQYARELISTIPMSNGTKEKIGRRTKGKTYGELYGEKAEEQKEKRRLGLLGKKHTEERNNNQSESLKGQIPWNKGLTKETNDKVKQYSENRVPPKSYKHYIVLDNNGNKLEFNGKTEFKDYFHEINKQLKKGYKINVDILINKKEHRNYICKLNKK